MSDIGEFFTDKSVLVTGATGFLGKVLVEKLLRSCESIETIFILIRTKKNENSEERFKKYCNNAVFNRLKVENIESFKKLKVISGDVALNNLGISDKDRQELIEKVQVIFHCAAAIRFDLRLSEIMKINVKGTLGVLQLAEKFLNLKAFVFVSTAFSQSYQTSIEERHYPTDFEVLELLKLDDRETREVEKQLLKKGHPSTYTMSKAFAEDLVYQYRNILPVVVIRPSVIVGAFREPEEGYIEGLQSVTGIIAGALTGLVRVALTGRKTHVAVTSVDFTTNAIIAATFKRSKYVLGTCPFFNVSLKGSDQLTWLVFLQYMSQSLASNASYKNLFWYPAVTHVSNIYSYTVMFFLTQLIPAMLFDFFLIISIKKPFFTKQQTKIYAATQGFRYFSTTKFDIRVDKISQLREELNETDKKIFLFDHSSVVDWEEEVKKQMRGVRKFVLREDENTIPMARRKLKKLYWADVILKAICSLGCLYLTFTLLTQLMKLALQ